MISGRVINLFRQCSAGLMNPLRSMAASRSTYSTGARPTTLTLDDVLPTSGEASRPTQGLASGMIPDQQPGLAENRRPSPFYPNMLNRRRTIEIGSDPIKRKSGEKTHYSLIVRSTSNNTRLTLIHTPVSYLPGSSPGNPIFKKAYPRAGSIVATVTAGTVGFKRGRRQEYEAAIQATLSMFNKIRDLLRTQVSLSSNKPTIREGLPRELEVVFDGFGIGRDAFVSSILNSQATDLREMVRSVRDTTTLKIGGPRPKKRRRV